MGLRVWESSNVGNVVMCVSLLWESDGSWDIRA